MEVKLSFFATVDRIGFEKGMFHLTPAYTYDQTDASGVPNKVVHLFDVEGPEGDVLNGLHLGSERFPFDNLILGEYVLGGAKQDSAKQDSETADVMRLLSSMCSTVCMVALSLPKLKFRVEGTVEEKDKRTLIKVTKILSVSRS